jgi:hypothetical protein
MVKLEVIEHPRNVHFFRQFSVTCFFFWALLASIAGLFLTESSEPPSISRHQPTSPDLLDGPRTLLPPQLHNPERGPFATRVQSFDLFPADCMQLIFQHGGFQSTSPSSTRSHRIISPLPRPHVPWPQRWPAWQPSRTLPAWLPRAGFLVAKDNASNCS